MHQSAAGGHKAISSPLVGMTSAETSAASFDPSFAEAKGWSLRRFLAPFAVGLALLSTFLTFVVLTGLTRIEPTRIVVVSFLLINAAIILLLAGIIVREVWLVVQARRRGRAAARLHVQIVRLFSGPTREVIQNSVTIARAYVQEHAQLIRGDILGVTNDIANSRARLLYDQDRKSFREFLTASAASRNLPGAMLIDKDRNILETADTGIQLAFTPPEAEFLTNNVNENEPEIAVLPDQNTVAAVIRLRTFNDTYLYVARPLDPRVVQQLKHTEASA